jgi:hypothetical protein
VITNVQRYEALKGLLRTELGYTLEYDRIYPAAWYPNKRVLIISHTARLEALLHELCHWVTVEPRNRRVYNIGLGAEEAEDEAAACLLQVTIEKSCGIRLRPAHNFEPVRKKLRGYTSRTIKYASWRVQAALSRTRERRVLRAISYALGYGQATPS